MKKATAGLLDLVSGLIVGGIVSSYVPKIEIVRESVKNEKQGDGKNSQDIRTDLRQYFEGKKYNQEFDYKKY